MTLESPPVAAEAGGTTGSPDAPPAAPGASGVGAPSPSAAGDAAPVTDAPVADTPAADVPAADAAAATATSADVPGGDVAAPGETAGTVATAESGGEVPPADPAGGALRSERISLVAASGQAMTVGVRTPLGKHIVRQFGDEASVWDAEQCVIERGADGTWQIAPGERTTNETLLNGEAITSPRPLHDGDVIAVGKVEKGIAKLPLTARAG